MPRTVDDVMRYTECEGVMFGGDDAKILAAEILRLRTAIAASEKAVETADQVFISLCEVLGCARDNEAALAAVAAKDAEIARLRGAIEEHRADVWGDSSAPVMHEFDRRLYHVLLTRRVLSAAATKPEGGE